MSQDKHRATDAGAGAAADAAAQTTDHGKAAQTAGDAKKAGGAPGRQAVPSEKPRPNPANIAKAGGAAGAGGETRPKTALPPAAPTPATTPAPTPRRGTTAIAVLSLLLTLGVIGAVSYFWQQYGQRQQQLDQHIAAVQQSADRANQGAATVGDKVSDLQGKVAALNQSVQSTATQLGAKVDGAVSDMQAKNQALQDSVQKVHDQLQRRSDDWIAAEAEYLIRVASQRLQLTGDTRTAMRALENADSRLHDMGDPSLLDVRKKIADDIVALRAVAQPDLTGMSLTLTGLSDHVADLPVAGAQPVSATLTTQQDGAAVQGGTAAGGWRQYLNRLWAGLRQLVVIRHPGVAGGPMLTPDERVILRQNLRLQLEAARVALLRGNERVFRDTLAGADKWLGEYFDTKAAAVSSMRETIKQLQDTDLAPPLPDLSGDLKALRDWEDQHTGKAGAGGADAGKAAS